MDMILPVLSLQESRERDEIIRHYVSNSSLDRMLSVEVGQELLLIESSYIPHTFSYNIIKNFLEQVYIRRHLHEEYLLLEAEKKLNEHLQNHRRH
ncbi:MAG: hypothetical protein KC535_03075 [Nanoarchaeota archaeon]|nr:hypothetical protein [Nanoarchaeota archaeon]